jgi:cytochrome c oxidase subunit II
VPVQIPDPSTAPARKQPPSAAAVRPAHGPTRRAASLAAQEALDRRTRRIRAAAFGAIVVGVLGIGVILASADLMGQRGVSTVAAAVPMRIGMGGFEPRVIHARPEQTVTLDWWNTDGAIHLQGGVHTMVSDSLGIRLELPAESRKTVTITAPTRPGDYDFWCDSCCGGKSSPSMHGILRVEA